WLFILLNSLCFCRYTISGGSLWDAATPIPAGRPFSHLLSRSTHNDLHLMCLAIAKRREQIAVQRLTVYRRRAHAPANPVRVLHVDLVDGVAEPPGDPEAGPLRRDRRIDQQPVLLRP